MSSKCPEAILLVRMILDGSGKNLLETGLNNKKKVFISPNNSWVVGQALQWVDFMVQRCHQGLDLFNLS